MVGLLVVGINPDTRGVLRDEGGCVDSGFVVYHLVSILPRLRGWVLGRPVFFLLQVASPISRGRTRRRNTECETAMFWAEMVILQFGH